MWAIGDKSKYYVIIVQGEAAHVDCKWKVIIVSKKQYGLIADFEKVFFQRNSILFVSLTFYTLLIIFMFIVS
jgi:hypothetical protein